MDGRLCQSADIVPAAHGATQHSAAQRTHYGDRMAPSAIQFKTKKRVCIILARVARALHRAAS